MYKTIVRGILKLFEAKAIKISFTSF